MHLTVRAVFAAGVLALALPCVVSAQAIAGIDSPVDQQSSDVGFTVSARLLFTIHRDGKFKDFTGSVAYDPDRPSNTKVDLTVYTAVTRKTHTAWTGVCQCTWPRGCAAGDQ